MITKQQVTWASQHDWFFGCTKTKGMNGTKGMYYVVTVIDSVFNELVDFDNFADLQAWAGH